MDFLTGKELILAMTKFNSNRQDEMQHYWHDLRGNLKVYPERVEGGSSVMVWGMVSFRGVVTG